MVLLYISLQMVGFVLALAFASLGYGGSSFWDLSAYHYIFNIIIYIALLAPFTICLLLFRMDFLRAIFMKKTVDAEE